MSADPAKKALVPQRRTLNISISDGHAEQLARFADAVTEGNRSHAIAYLLDEYAGKIVEREAQRKELEEKPAPVVRWKQSRLTAELAGYIAGMVRAGNMPEIACDLAGVSNRQRLAWLKKGRADITNSVESVHADFVMAMTRAEAECEAEDIARIRAHGKASWQAVAWRLERQYPDRYAQRKRIDGKVQHSMMPVIDYDLLNLAEQRTLVELLRKASPDQHDPGVSRSARPALELVPADVLETIDGEAYELSDVPAPAEKPDP